MPFVLYTRFSMAVSRNPNTSMGYLQEIDLRFWMIRTATTPMHKSSPWHENVSLPSARFRHYFGEVELPAAEGLLIMIPAGMWILTSRHGRAAADARMR